MRLTSYHQVVVDGLEASKINYFLYVPGTAFPHIIDYFDRSKTVLSLQVAREEEGIGILGGLILGGKRPVLMMQDNGLGNAQEALTTFRQAYHIPMKIFSVRRGSLGEFNSAMHHFTEHVPEILKALNVKTFSLGKSLTPQEWRLSIPLAYEHSFVTHRPIVVLLDFD